MRSKEGRGSGEKQERGGEAMTYSWLWIMDTTASTPLIGSSFISVGSLIPSISFQMETWRGSCSEHIV